MVFEDGAGEGVYYVCVHEEVVLVRGEAPWFYLVGFVGEGYGLIHFGGWGAYFDQTTRDC